MYSAILCAMRPDEYKTRCGMLILDFLKNSQNKSVSAKEIAQHLAQKGEPANITTVYRRLEKLVSEKKLISHSSENGKTILYQYTEANPACLEHIHFQCTACRKIFHLDCDAEREFINHIEKKHGLKIDFSKTVLHGLCADCSKKNLLQAETLTGS